MDPLLTFFTIIGGLVTLGSLGIAVGKWIRARRQQREAARREAHEELLRRAELISLRVELLNTRDYNHVVRLHERVREILSQHPEDSDALLLESLIDRGRRGHETYETETGDPLRTTTPIETLLQVGMALSKTSPAAGCVFWAIAALVVLGLFAVNCPR